MVNYAILISGIVTSAIPLLLATVGEIVAERAGVLNLATEGAMAVAAAVAALVGIASGSAWLGLAAGTVAGLAWVLLYATLSVGLRADQIATGIALSIAGVGAAAVIGKGLEGYTVPTLPTLASLLGLPPGSPLSLVDAATPFLLVVPIAAHLLLHRTRLGLAIRAVGDNPWAADAFGVDVALTRLAALLIDGVLVGLAGAYLVTVVVPRWVPGLTGGRGWIAVALAPFSYWEPLLAYLGAFLFASIEYAQYILQALGVRLPRELLLSLPYLALIAALAALRSERLRARSPRALAKVFERT